MCVSIPHPLVWCGRIYLLEMAASYATDRDLTIYVYICKYIKSMLRGENQHDGNLPHRIGARQVGQSNRTYTHTHTGNLLEDVETNAE